jgi:lactate 2-monooxygenase
MAEQRPSAIGRQAEIYLAGVAGRRPRVPVDPARLEQAAAEAMTEEAFAYVAGGAGTESTVRENRDAFERWRIVPRMLRDVSTRDTSLELFGARLHAPVLLSPVGVLEMAHPEADVAVARAAAECGVPYIFSSQASRSMEECAAAMGDAPRWFQLYWSKSDALVESFVRRAEAAGAGAIVVTLDTTMLGWRTRDLDLGYLPFLRGKGIAQYVTDPVFLDALRGPLPEGVDPNAKRTVNVSSLRTFAELTRAHPGGFWKNVRRAEPLRAVQQFIGTYSRPSLTWDELPFLRERTRLPIVLKGILHPDDARRAVDAGMDGIIVSNHGGRQVDGAVSTLDALPPIARAVDGRIPVLMDSGVRTGADVFKALALGARAVCIGRPYVYGLALAGEEGVAEVVRNLLADFELTMGLAGCRSLAEITGESLVRARG